jgi:uncharacterized protein YukE
MIRTLRYRTVLRSIHPPEADHLAEELRSCSRQTDSYRQEVNRLISDLSASWSGHQKDAFMAAITRVPTRLEFIMEMFTNQSEFYRNLQITVEESVPVED